MCASLDTLLVLRKIEQAGVEVWACNDSRRLSLADDTSEIMAMPDSWRDTSERRKTITRVRNAAFNRHASGYVTGGKVFGYTIERLSGAGKQPARRVIDETTAPTVRRIFTMARDGYGLQRIAKTLNAEGVAAPRSTWEPCGVREVLHRDLYRGVEVFGKVRRDRVNGRKRRVEVPESEWQRRECPELRIVDTALWDAAHTRMAETAAAYKRRSGGRLVGHAENLQGRYLLSGMLTCGVCHGPMIAAQRGRNRRPSYICQNHRQRGSAVCANSTAVPMDRLHAGVVATLRDTLSPETFGQHLRRAADDDEARERRAAERLTLVAEIPRLSAVEAKLAKAVALADDVEALVTELKAAQQQRKAAEARLIELEDEERTFQAAADTVERFRAAWGDWHGALDADPMLARQLLRKALLGPVLVVPDERHRGEWTFAGYSHFDGLLTGRVAPGKLTTVRWANRAEIDALVREHPDHVGRGASAWAALPIGGGSDAPNAHVVCGNGGATEMAPHTPHASRPGEAVALRERR